MSSGNLSTDTFMEDGESFVSNTDAIINGTSDISGLTLSLISDPNIPNSSDSSTSIDDHLQQISTAAGGCDNMIVSSGATNSRIFNSSTDFRAFSRNISAVWNNYSDKVAEEGSAESSNRMRSEDGLELCLGLSIGTEAVNEEPLVKILLACGEAVQRNNQTLADALVRLMREHAVSQFGPMKKVATYFAKALDQRIQGMNLEDIMEFSCYTDNLMQMRLHEIRPYLEFAYSTANRAILEAFPNSSTRVHIIDFSLNQGPQWLALMQEFALRPGGPPAIRLTGIGSPDNTNALRQLKWKLTEFADIFGVEFEFRGIMVDSLADVDTSRLDIRPSNYEEVAVNSIFELHHLLYTPGEIEKVLNSIKEMHPKIVTIIEEEANRSVFMDRFNDAWSYYSKMFDSLENSESTHDQHNSGDSRLVHEYLGQQINNMVACELGTELVETTLSEWRVKMNSAGFNPVQLGPSMYVQATMILDLFQNRYGYRVEQNNGCLTLSWHGRPLISTSVWQLKPPSLG
ncbi:PREDICTED: DELLA protein GAI-like [Nicotiana attenuata]|uniref:Della protein gai n=1 Tax=Nicotiana attenuata TaxID=49451 RepID=A0A1J6K2Q1_NICAT|nr:PREDICTED: DELLA protein GAI-like [Nicotiana attenuata]OIT19400.1 della protein gai [Nicotiana attenuata]